MSERQASPAGSASRFLRRGVKRALSPFGLQLSRIDVRTSAAARRMSVIERYRVDLVIDVGANRGDYPQMLRDHGYDGRVVSFEPLKTAFEELRRRASRDPAWECWDLALGERDGMGTLNVAGNSESSSLLEMAPDSHSAAPDAAYIGEQPVEVARLDTIWERAIGSCSHGLLKADVQGYEREVLRGAAESLRSISVLDLELELAELYTDQPLIAEMIDYVSGLGFQLFALDPVFTDPESGQLLSVDGLFVRT